MNRTLRITGLSLLVALLTACDSGNKISDVDVQTVTVPELRSMLANTKDQTVLVDVRTPAKFDTGHLPDAFNIPVRDIAASDMRLADSKNIVVYAADIKDADLSTAAAKKMLSLGYKNVYDFRGGVELWRVDGGRVTEPAPGAVGTIVTPATQPASR